MKQIRKITLASIASLFISVAIFNAVAYEFNLNNNSTIALLLFSLLFLLIDVAILNLYKKTSTNSLIVPLGAVIVISLVIGSMYASMLAGKQASNRVQYEPEKTTNDNENN